MASKDDLIIKVPGQVKPQLDDQEYKNIIIKTEKIFRQYVFEGEINTLKSFKQYVTSHEYPVIVLFKKK